MNLKQLGTGTCSALLEAMWSNAALACFSAEGDEIDLGKCRIGTFAI